MANKQTRSRTARVWTITAFALILIFYAVHLMTRGSLPIRVAAATIGDLRSTVATNGKVEPQPQVNFEAHAPFSGIIQTVDAHEGDKVPAGKLLVAMDDTEARARVATALAALKGAQAADQAAQRGGTQEERISLTGDLQKAQIDRDQAQHDLEALQKLQGSGAASPSEVSAAQTRLAADNSSLQVLQQRRTARYDSADLAHTRATLDDAQAAYDAAVDALHHAVVHAPFTGTVYSLPVSRTEYVNQGDRLLSMADLSKLQVLAYFDEPEIGKLSVGQPVTILWDARPDEQWRGVISRLPSTIITYGTSRNVGAVSYTHLDVYKRQGLPAGSFCRTSETCWGCLTPVACRMASAYLPGGRPGIVISTVRGDPATPQKNCVSAAAFRSLASRRYNPSTVRVECWMAKSMDWIDPAMPSNCAATAETVCARTAAALPDCTFAASICADCSRTVR